MERSTTHHNTNLHTVFAMGFTHPTVQSVGLLNSPPTITSAHGPNCASVLKLKCPAAAC